MRIRLTIQAANYYHGRIVDPNLIVVHATSGNRERQERAVGVASYFRRGAPGSTQWVSDDTTDVRCVADSDTCWGAYRHNSNGLHFEFCGHADWSRERWLEHRATLEGGAVLIAESMKKYRIPFVYPAPIINGKAQNGIHTHYGLPGNDHTDPAPGPSHHGVFPMDVLLAEIKKGLGAGHAIATSPPAQGVRLLADIRKRNVITTRVAPTGKPEQVRQGWRDCKGVLQYLATGGHLEPSTVVEIAWQGTWFSGSQDKMRNIARSIYTRYA